MSEGEGQYSASRAASISPGWRAWDLEADARSIQGFWNNLPDDPYVAAHDRARRYAVALYCGSALRRMPDEPHVQALAHNRLFGGVERKLAAIQSDFFEKVAVTNILIEAVTAIPVTRPCWRLQLHQIRIRAPGRPTPEGLHRDGASYVLMVMIRRQNVSGGVTSLYGMDDDQPLTALLMERPGQALLIDDERLRHSVSPIELSSLGAQEGNRDMLIVTFHPTSAPCLCHDPQKHRLAFP